MVAVVPVGLVQQTLHFHDIGLSAMFENLFEITQLSVKSIQAFKASQALLKEYRIAVFDENMLLLHNFVPLDLCFIYSGPLTKSGAAVACCRLLAANDENEDFRFDNILYLLHVHIFRLNIWTIRASRSHCRKCV